MSYLNSFQEWNQIHPEDLWIYNKLILSRVLEYNCGPCGIPVPKPDFYLVRPCMNLLGMGRNSRIIWLESETEKLMYPSDFWSEIFSGDHLSVDFYRGIPKLIVRGYREKEEDPLWKWHRWKKIDLYEFDFPKILENLKGSYDWINCEFIGNKLIEVHFRRNPDFRFGNKIAIPVWKKSKEKKKNIQNLIDILKILIIIEKVFG